MNSIILERLPTSLILNISFSYPSEIASHERLFKSTVHSDCNQKYLSVIFHVLECCY